MRGQVELKSVSVRDVGVRSVVVTGRVPTLRHTPDRISGPEKAQNSTIAEAIASASASQVFAIHLLASF